MFAQFLAAGDHNNLVRLRATEYLALTDQQNPEKNMLEILAAAKSKTEANLILNTVTLLMDAKGYSFDLRKLKFNSKWLTEGDALVMRRLEYLLAK